MEVPDSSTSPIAHASNRVIRWLLAEELTDTDIAEGWAFSERVPDVGVAKRHFRTFARSIGTVASYREVSDRLAVLEVQDDQGRFLTLRVFASRDGTGRVVGFGLFHRIPPDVVIRLATEDDRETLRDIEAATPVEHDGVTIRYRRADPFAQFRLVDAEVICLIAEVDGQPAAQHIDLRGTQRIGGANRTIAYRMRTRIRPEYQGRKLWPALNWTAGESISDDSRETLIETSFLALGNTKIDDLLGEQASMLWSQEVHKLTFDVRATPFVSPSPTRRRRGETGDASEIARRLDATHGKSELAPTFTAQWISERLTRSAADYTWRDIVLLGDAAIGVWDPGLELTIDRDGDIETRQQALVLDWGTAGSTDDLIGALGGAVDDLTTSDATHLSMFVSPALPTYGPLAGLAIEIDKYRFFCRVPEPSDASERGLHVDPLWF
jgi:hypothetical protein